MSNIETNVVKMVMDTVGFQKSADEAINVVNKLKEALKLEQVADGLKNVGDSLKGMGFEAMINGVSNVQNGFNALDVVATRVLQNITDKVQNVATDLAKKVTIEPLKAGLEEYETQINSVQTILANTNDALIEKGMTSEHDRIEKVNSVLDELNQYADMTIYNFTEMTRNIGTFTAAGVELDTAATSIKGIANLAAMSGSNSQQASTAMYQLSQAIAAGSVKLQDWNSVVNAGMGGKLFQNELIDTAKAMGVADEQFVALTNGATTFRESLSSGWISAEVLTNTLEKFTAGSEGYTKAQVQQMQELWRARGYSETQIKELTGSINQLNEEQEKNLRTKWAEKGFSDEQIDHILSMGSAATDAATKVKTFHQLLETVEEALQSGWTQSWEYIIGDFEQAKRLWTEISDIMNLYIGKSADKRNEMLAEWSKATYSWNEEGKLIKNAVYHYDEAGNKIIDVDEQIVESGQMVADEMGGRELIIQGIRNAFQACLEVGMEFGKAWDTYFWGKDPTDKIDDISLNGQKLKDFSRQLYDASVDLKAALTTRNEDGEAIGTLGRLHDIFVDFAANMRVAFQGIKDVFNGLGNVFDAFFHSSFFSLDTLDSLGQAIQVVTTGIGDFGAAIKKNLGADESGANREGLMKFFSGLQGVLESATWVKINFINEGLRFLGDVIGYVLGPGETLATLLGKVGDKLSDFAHGIDSIFVNEDDISKFADLFSNLSDGIKPFIDSIKSIFDIKIDNGAIDGFTAFINQLKGIMNGSMGIDVFDTIAKSIESIVNVVKTLAGVAAPLIQAFVNVFGPSLTQIVKYIGEFINRIHELTSSLVPNEEAMKTMYELFKSIFEVIRSVGILAIEGLLSVWDGLKSAISSILPEGDKASNIIKQIAEHLHEFAGMISDLATGEGGVSTFGEIIANFGERFGTLLNTIKDLDPLEKLVDMFSKLGDGIKKALGGTDDMSLMDTVAQKLKDFFKTIKDIFSDEDGDLDLGKVFAAGGVGGVLVKLLEFIKDFGKKVSTFSKIADILNDFADTVGGAIENIGNKFKSDSIKAVATSMLEIAAALFILSAIDTGRLAQSIVAMQVMFKEIERILVITSTIDKGNVSAAAKMFAALGTAMLELSIAVSILGKMELGQLMQGIVAVTILLAELTGIALAFSKFKGSLAEGAGGLILLALALNLLVIPIEILGHMDFKQLAKGLGAVTIMLAELTGAAILLGKFGGGFTPKDGVALILMAEAIKMVGKAVATVADLSWEGVAKGLVVMTAALAEMVGAAAIISKAHLGDELATLSVSLVLFGASMLMIAAAVQGISGVSWEDIGKAGAILAGALIALGIAAAVINGPNLFLIGSGFLMIAEAITLLIAAITAAQILIPIATGIGAAFSGITSALTEFANHSAASAFLKFLEDAILFLPRLAVGLAQAVVTFIAELGKAAGEVVKAIVGIGKEILKGVVELIPEAFNVVKTFFSELLALVPSLVTELIPKLFEVLGTFFTNLWAFLTEQTPQFFAWLTTVITELVTFLQTNAITIMEAIRQVLQQLLIVIITEAPLIGQTFLVVLMTILEVIQTAIPAIVNTLLTLLLDLLQQLATFVPQMAQAALEIINGFLQAVAENIGSITQSAIDIAIAFIDGVAEKMPEIVDSAFKLIIGFIEGLAQAIDNNHNDLFSAVGHLIKSIIEAIVDGITQIGKSAGDLITGPGGFLDGLKSFATDIFNAGANAVQGFIDGLLSLPGQLWDAACSIAHDAWSAMTQTLEEHSPSRLTFGGGANFTIGFANGIIALAKRATDASSTMASDTVEAMTDILDGANPTLPDIDGGNINLKNVDITAMSDDISDSVVTAGKSLAQRVLSAICDVFGQESTEITPTVTPQFDFAAFSTTLFTDIIGDTVTLITELCTAIMTMTKDLLENITPLLSFEDIVNAFLQSTTTVITTVVDATMRLTTDFITSVFALLGQVSNDKTNTTITPVLDDSQLRDRTATVYAKVVVIPSTSDIQDSLLMKKQLEAKISDSITTESDYSSIVNEIHSLRNDMATFSEMISKLDVVLDSGVLVGELTPGIDRALGMNAVLQRRGV